MLFKKEHKTQISKMLMDRYSTSGFGSEAQFARSVGLKPADFSNIKNGKWEGNSSLIGEAKWIKIAQFVGFVKHAHLKWATAKTAVYEFITEQLEMSQEYAMTVMLVDDAGIGKTYTAQEYTAQHKSVIYMDCSVTPRKQAFIRSLARSVGVGDAGTLDELLEASIYALRQMDKPLVILDEAGDIDDKTLLVIKRMYNALEDYCGFYLIGADGLRSKIERGLAYKKLGYQEFFSRFGKKFSGYMPALLQEKKEVLKRMAEQIAEANGVQRLALAAVVSKLWDSGLGDMRRIKREVLKLKVA